MKARPDEKAIQTIKDAARKLTGSVRREFQATVTLDHCHGSPRFASELFGWNPCTIRKGLAEREMNCIIVDRKRTGRRKYIEKLVDLQTDIRSLVDPNSRTHPTFENTFRYTRMTAKAVLEALVQEKGYKKKNCLLKVQRGNYSARWVTVCVECKRPNLKKNSRNKRHIRKRKIRSCKK